MPIVLRVGGFRFAIYAPPREHGPPHVHVFASDGSDASISIPEEGEESFVRSANGMRDTVAWQACRMVDAHATYLLAKWRELHDAPR